MDGARVGAWSHSQAMFWPSYVPGRTHHTVSPKDAQGGHNTPLVGGWQVGLPSLVKKKTKSTSHIQNPQPPKCNWGVRVYIVTFLNSYGEPPKLFFSCDGPITDSYHKRKKKKKH
jgi:hypothetical protein